MAFKEFTELMAHDKTQVIIRKTDDELICRAKTGCMSQRIIKIPSQVTPEISFLAGMIIGDGTLCGKKYRVTIDLAQIEILRLISKTFKEGFDVEFPIKKCSEKRPHHVIRHRVDFHCKAIWLYFHLVLGIPFGKKSKIVRIPKPILSDRILIKPFLSGLFLADFGRKGKKLAFTTTSMQLFEDVKIALTDFEIQFSVRVWKIKSTKVFDIIMGRKSSIYKFLKTFPLVEMKLQGSPSPVNGARWN